MTVIVLDSVAASVANLAEDQVHHLGASSKGGHDLMPVNQFCRSGLVVTGQQRDCFGRHAMSGQQRYERMPQLAGNPCAAQPRSLGDLTELSADIVIIEWRPDGGAEDQAAVLPQFTRPQLVLRLDRPVL